MPLLKKLRFCMVTTFYPPYHFGGDAVYIYRLVEALAEQGHQVDVIYSRDAYHLQNASDPSIQFTHHPNVNRYPLTSQHRLASSLVSHQLGRPGLYGRETRRILDNGRYDVIHFHNVSLVGGPGILRFGSTRSENAAIERPVKLYSAHEYWLICPTHALFTFNREACTQRRCLRCTLHSGRPPQLWRYTGLLRECLEHIDCLITPSRFALERHRAAGINRPMVKLPYLVPSTPPNSAVAVTTVPKQPFFLFAGRLEKLKGVQDLLKVFADYREARLVIVGSGSYAATLRQQAHNLDHVTFLEHVHPSALVEFYRETIALLAPSLCYETFGLSVAEAMAQGTPVIIRRIGALPELIAANGGGLVFDTLAECRKSMELLQRDPDLRAELGQRGRQTAEQLWSTEVHLSQYLRVISNIQSGQDVSA